VSQLLKWPLPALWVWGGAWLIYLNGSDFVPELWAMGLACGVAVAFSGLGTTTARRWALALGFPVSLWLSGAATLPAWAWLVPLGLALLIYPVHAWHDAPIFPTPLNALRDLPGAAALPADALVLDAGCGVGDGLRALRLAYPQARFAASNSAGPCVLRRRCAAHGHAFGMATSGKPTGRHTTWCMCFSALRPCRTPWPKPVRT